MWNSKKYEAKSQHWLLLVLVLYLVSYDFAHIQCTHDIIYNGMAIWDAEGTFHSMGFLIESGIATMIRRNKNNFLGLVLTE